MKKNAGAAAVVLLCIVSLAAVVAAWRTGEPSHERRWMEAQRILPRATVDGEQVTVHGVRNFRWRSSADYEPRWETRSYDLSRIERVWFGVSPFARGWRGPAHTFLSFEFSDSQYVTVSVEARREEGEEYSIVDGLLNRFEVIYVVADERDVIALRTNAWGDPVHLYPISAEPARVREVFLAMMERVEEIRARPEFYNTFVHNCTSALLDAANRARERPLRYGLDVALPGYADRRLHRLGLIDPDLSLAAARAKYLINERATAAPATDDDFSYRIRRGS